MQRVVSVTPAGRKRYIELLKHYVLRDATICEWHLWDNCRKDDDRTYINDLAQRYPKIKIIQTPRADGTNRSVNRFYPFCDDPEAFYIKMDDDLVYLPENIGARLCQQAMSERDKYIWWSPLVLNNAICSWLLKYHSKVDIPEAVTCQASDRSGWVDPKFAELMHERFLAAAERGELEKFRVGNFDVSLSRFSINCIGFFGRDVIELGDRFCPPGVDDEEWISAVLPSMVQRPGRIVGSLVASHFSFSTQERELLQSRILDKYYRCAGLEPTSYAIPRLPLRERIYLGLRGIKNAAFGLTRA
jgi:hypothetical protein